MAGEEAIEGRSTRWSVMVPTSPRDSRQGEDRPHGRPLSELRLTTAEARELRAHLASFAREWDDPRIDVYDDAA